MSDPIRAALDKAAEALWLAESLRAAGRIRLTEWKDESEDTRQKWRFMAAHGNAAFLRALPDLSVCPRLACNYNGSGDSSATLADAVLAAAKEDRE
jgi:hypothetical protein